MISYVSDPEYEGALLTDVDLCDPLPASSTVSVARECSNLQHCYHWMNPNTLAEPDRT
jgi:hypothetical protein